MTAPTPKVTLTPEVYDYFRRYYAQPDHGAWGIYHVWLDDGNYDLDPIGEPNDCSGFYRVTDEDRRMWEVFREMTPSQRRRIAKRCRLPEPEPYRGPPMRVVAVDHESGIVTLESSLEES